MDMSLCRVYAMPPINLSEIVTNIPIRILTILNTFCYSICISWDYAHRADIETCTTDKTKRI